MLFSSVPFNSLGILLLSFLVMRIFAKQAWRLIQNTHSLFYRVYKSRYFPNCSFMDAEMGNNPSYGWRSLLAAIDIIKNGSKWQVGDGRYIEVSTHKWLTHKPVFLGEIQPNFNVKDLIDSATGQWDREKLFDHFAYRTRMEIAAASAKVVFKGCIGLEGKQVPKIYG